MAQKVITGKVISTKMNKSAVVEVTRKVPHALYKKLITVSKRYVVDTNGVAVAQGDEVKLVATRKMGANKYFKIEGKTK